jgi:hypothetical protein
MRITLLQTVFQNIWRGVTCSLSKATSLLGLTLAADLLCPLCREVVPLPARHNALV